MLLPSGVFCLALIISLTLLRYLWEANRAVSHSDLVLAQTNETFRRVATSQSVARGYLLYHRPRFLESYRESKEKLGVELGELAQLTADNGQQQAALQLLVPRLKSLLEFSDRALETEREGKHALWNDQQEALAVEIRDRFNQFLAREQKLRAERREYSQDLVARAVWALVLGAVVFGSGVAIYLRHLLTHLLRGYWRVLKIAEQGAAVRERDYFFTMPSHLMCISGQDGYFKQLSQGWERTLGYSREELLSRPFVEFVRPEDREVTREVKEDADLHDQLGFINCYRHQDGSDVWLRWSSSPRPESGLVYSSAVDVTAERQAEQEIRRLNSDLQFKVAELDRLNQELESFAYSVSHDLRTPLRALDGFAQALLRTRHEQLDAQGQQFLERIKLAAQKMGILIDDLLLLSRVTRAEIKRAPIDLSAMAVEILQELQHEDPDRRVKTQVAPDLRMIGDPNLIRIMLANLLGNAWKYTGKGEEAILSFQRVGRAFCVRDNGVGFNMEYQDKLFQPFQRLHRPGEFEGTGIGLATVDRVVRRHGGKIWAESEVNQGAAFFFEMPEEN
ncbi:MAG: CHASE3 domain-containing protein [Candidatus Eremiobacteraeota bacterium]|nr:CHASE3 domain-containing protein [Candidatus Eremiobacteraeota bacterium]